MKPSDLRKRLTQAPFRPFRVHISDGTAVDLMQPGMVIVGESTAVIPTLTITDEYGYRIAKNWRTVALDDITRFSNIDASGGKRRKTK